MATPGYVPGYAYHVGRPPAPRYGAWYVSPKTWSVGMADDDVYAKRIARDKDPWRVQMTQLKKREERLA